MADTVVVTDVIQTNTCSGKVEIVVESKAWDESYGTQWVISPTAMFADQRLDLTTVQAGDTVEVHPYMFQQNSINGTYSRIVKRGGVGLAVCRCGQMLVADQLTVFCRNPRCGMSLHTRLMRLANIDFFTGEASPSINNFDFDLSTVKDNNPKLHRVLVNSIFGGMDRDFVLLQSDPLFRCPFHIILNTGVWGMTGFRLQDILVSNRIPALDLATFISEDLFRNFVEDMYPVTRDDAELHPISQFYGIIQEIQNRRNPRSTMQNHFINRLMHGLCIEALRDDVIQRMLDYELVIEYSDDPFLAYALAITDTSILTSVMGVHPMEANAIVSEVNFRREEFLDIFRSLLTPMGYLDVCKNIRLK